MFSALFLDTCRTYLSPLKKSKTLKQGSDPIRKYSTSLRNHSTVLMCIECCFSEKLFPSLHLQNIWVIWANQSPFVHIVSPILNVCMLAGLVKQTGIMGPNQRRWGTGYHPGLGHGKWYRCRSFLKWEDRGQESGPAISFYVMVSKDVSKMRESWSSRTWVLKHHPSFFGFKSGSLDKINKKQQTASSTKLLRGQGIHSKGILVHLTHEGIWATVPEACEALRSCSTNFPRGLKNEKQTHDLANSTMSNPDGPTLQLSAIWTSSLRAVFQWGLSVWRPKCCTWNQAGFMLLYAGYIAITWARIVRYCIGFGPTGCNAGRRFHYYPFTKHFE